MLSSRALFAVPVKHTRLPLVMILTRATGVTSGMFASWT